MSEKRSQVNHAHYLKSAWTSFKCIEWLHVCLMVSWRGFNGVVIPCHSSRTVSHVIAYLASLLHVVWLRVKSRAYRGTSAAHLGDGCRGYRPGALCASIMGGMCSETGQWGLQPGGASVGAAVPWDTARTSGAAGWTVTTLSLARSVASGAAPWRRRMTETVHLSVELGSFFQVAQVRFSIFTSFKGSFKIVLVIATYLNWFSVCYLHVVKCKSL